MESNLPLLSVIIPVYNVEKYLKECVDSVINQTLQDIEIILVDDKSPDNCASICDEYAEKDSRVKVIHKAQNEGLGYARNSGLSLATGEYVTFIDSDDYIDKEAYYECYNFAKEKDLDCVRFLYQRFKGNRNIPVIWEIDGCLQICDDKDLIISNALYILDRPAEWENYKVIFPTNGSSCTGIYRTEFLKTKKIKFYSERDLISEDIIFGLDVALNCHNIGFINKAFYHYRINVGSLSTIIRKDRVRKCKDFTIFLSEKIKSEGINEKLQSFVYGNYIHNFRVSCRQIFSSKLPIKEKKEWFKDEVSESYFQNVIREKYPNKRLPFKQRVIYFLMIYKCFLSTYIIIRIFDKIRKNPIKW